MTTLQKAINGQRNEITLGGKPIMGVQVLNPTPAFLYLHSLDTVGPSSYLAVIEPWSMATIPMVVAERLYVIDAGQVEALPANARALITALPSTPPLAVERIAHAYTTVLTKGQDVTAGEYVEVSSAAGLTLPLKAQKVAVYVNTYGGATLGGVEAGIDLGGGLVAPVLAETQINTAGTVAQVDATNLGASRVRVFARVLTAGKILAILAVNL